MIRVGSSATLRRVATTLSTVAALAVVAAMAAAPGAQAKTTWKVDANVVNQVASTAASCKDTLLIGCVSPNFYKGDGSVDDLSPPFEIPAGSRGGFSFTSPDLVEGGDLNVDYTMPTGSLYDAIVENDHHGSIVTGAGNYAGCTQAKPQNDVAAVCSAQWGGTYEAMTPTITFGPSSLAPVPSVGQRCSGTMGGAIDLLDCMDTKQVAPADPNLPMLITFQAITSAPVYVQQTRGTSCRMGQGYPSSCTIVLEPGGALQIGSLDNGTDASYSVEIMGTAIGYQLPSEFLPDPNLQSLAAVPAVRGLRVSPSAVRPAASGPVVSAKRLAKGRGATVRYRTSRDATTVFSLARAGSGERRGGSCVRTSRPVVAARRCGAWFTLPDRTVRSGVVASGVKHKGACRAASGRPAGPACQYRKVLRGHLLDHGKAGTNTLRITGRLAGKRLPAGRYRLTAQSRYHRGTGVSAPVTTRFTVVN